MTNHLTKSAKELRRRLDNDPTVAALLCDVLNVTPQILWTWKTGNRRPGPHFRDAIEILTSVSRDGWMTADERDVIRRAERARPPKWLARI